MRETFSSKLFQRNTAGLGVSAEVLDWVRLNRRPVSIVIPSYNDVPLLTECLASIDRTCAGFEYEVIVVDDYCQPENSERLRALEGGRVRMVFKEERQGFAVSVNVGMAQAKYDIVLLNSDIVAQAGWLDALQHAAYAIDPRIGLVSPKLVYPDGRIQYGGTYYARVLAPQWFGHLYVGSAATRPIANVASYNRSISGACVYVTQEAYARLGGLDETYWLGFEDVDYGLQAWKAGIRCFYEPQSLLIHHESASRGYSQGKRELASMRHFWARWEGLFLRRSVPETFEVDFVVSEKADAIWRRYVDEVADGLAERGVVTRVHVIDGPAADERLVAELEPRSSLVVCADWGSEETVWLSTLERGKPVYLLPTVESGLFPQDPALQTQIVARYRPEFAYVAANRWAADQLRAETAWETSARVVPALAPRPEAEAAAPEHPIARLISVGFSARDRARLERIAYGLEASIRHVDSALDTGAIERIAAERPTAVISDEEYPNSAAPLALMGIGAVYVGRANPRTAWEVLDGYNALLVDTASDDALRRALRDIVDDAQVRKELAANGWASNDHHHRRTAADLADALSSIARRAV
ncbi:hypothetical protein LLS1_26910 [Leifsonia sp. LS1]|uniref:glycosyltransferase n=1 Tax=Leifsonia sp. LS1 TaxID=2828483 RepID=UPI001CFD80F2|nr:glycosyltransferase [Leifsonia sp. LS1]GIT81022.1 hypothetical protein LLS1_26910 [Leifsonia sp. LS1]